MTEIIESLFSSVFGDNVILATILIAMVPIIELKGAIPFSMSTAIWGESALSFSNAFLMGIIGSSLIIPILVLIYKPIINLLKRTKIFKNLAIKIESKINDKKSKVENKISNIKEENENINCINNEFSEKLNYDTKENSNQQNRKANKKNLWIKIISVFTFVAIPIPFTGVWTGTCVAVALGLKTWIICVTVILGNIIAGLIITLISILFGDSTMIFVYVLFAVILAGLFYLLCRKILKNKKNNQKI